MTKTKIKSKINLLHKFKKKPNIYKFEQQQDDGILCWEALFNITASHTKILVLLSCADVSAFQRNIFLVFCSTTQLPKTASCFQWHYSSLPSIISITWSSFFILDVKLDYRKIVLCRLIFFSVIKNTTFQVV